jgi:hypothetical protein
MFICVSVGTSTCSDRIINNYISVWGKKNIQGLGSE